jgi:transposase
MHYPPSAWERIMKIQDVFERANRKTLTWREAAEILKVDERTIRRWKQTVELNGYEGLLDRRTRHPSPKRAPDTIQNQVLKLYRDQYKDWNVQHFFEQLTKYGIGYKYTWVKNLLQGAGYVEVKSRKSKHRQLRPRKPIPGMMLHIDGSTHRWVPNLSGFQDLIVVADDATSDIYYAKLVPQEDTRECMLALRHVVRSKGIFCSIYSDRASHFFRTPPASPKVDLSNLTQIGRALYELGIEPIPAYSPEARGRSERIFGTWQGRLPNELKFHGIKTVPDANRYILETFLPKYRAAFTKPAEQKGSAFTPYRGRNIDLVFSVKEQRSVGCDNTIHWNNRILQIQPSKFRISFAKCKVTVHEHLDQSVTITYGPHIIAKFKPGELQDKKTTKNQKRTNHVLQKADILTCC